MADPPPDWQLPPGVSRGMWHYVHSGDLARDYDASLAGSSLVTMDCHFVQHHCPPRGRLLDLGCGTGRLLVAMAKAGCRVVGVDLSGSMLQNAAINAAEAGVAVELVRANLVELGCFDDSTFDCAACLFSTLGMIDGPEARQRVVEHVHRLLRPGGIFVLHVHNRWFNAFRPGTRGLVAKDLLLDVLGRESGGDRPMPAHGNVPPLTLHLFTRHEAAGMLRSAGFLLKEIRPIGLGEDGKLRRPWCFGWLRAYGYLIAASKPG